MCLLFCLNSFLHSLFHHQFCRPFLQAYSDFLHRLLFFFPVLSCFCIFHDSFTSSPFLVSLPALCFVSWVPFRAILPECPRCASDPRAEAGRLGPVAMGTVSIPMRLFCDECPPMLSRDALKRSPCQVSYHLRLRSTLDILPADRGFAQHSHESGGRGLSYWPPLEFLEKEKSLHLGRGEKGVWRAARGRREYNWSRPSAPCRSDQPWNRV